MNLKINLPDPKYCNGCPCCYWWEQRFCEDYCRDGCKPENRRTCKQLAFIRAEIERVREEEKQAVMGWLRDAADEYNAESSMAARDTVMWHRLMFEQNKHRSEK